MQHSHRIAGVAVALAAVLATAPAALAIPPIDDDGPNLPALPARLRAGRRHLREDPAAAPAARNSPVLTLETPRQTTDQAAVRVAGRATDADQPATALTVRITHRRRAQAHADGEPARPAGGDAGRRQDVPPPVLPGHRFDVTIPAAAARTRCA